MITKDSMFSCQFKISDSLGNKNNNVYSLTVPKVEPASMEKLDSVVEPISMPKSAGVGPLMVSTSTQVEYHDIIEV